MHVTEGDFREYLPEVAAVRFTTRHPHVHSASSKPPSPSLALDAYLPTTMAPSMARGYLLLYNASMSLGWLAVLVQLILSLASSPADYVAAYAAAQKPLIVFQTGAILEVLHCFVGLVRAPVATTALQVGSRLLLVWGVAEPVVEVRSSPVVASMVGAWALTEIPRYAFFAWNAACGASPYWLGLLRYSTFIPLYPIGAGSEWVLLLSALPYLRELDLYSWHMPNWANFAFDFYAFCLFNLIMYIPGLPYMYVHMMRQRKRYIAKAGAMAPADAQLEKATKVN